MNLPLRWMAALAAAVVCGCTQTQALDPDSDAPIDLSDVEAAYNDYDHETEQSDSLLLDRLGIHLPEWGADCVFADTAFAVRLPQYAHSSNPFLATAEDFYNNCAFAWNVWSDFDWWAVQAQGEPDPDVTREMVESIRGISPQVINDPEVRKAALAYRDSIIMLMQMDEDKWDADPQEVMIRFANIAESKAYRFYDDEQAFLDSLTLAFEDVEQLARPRMKRIENADSANVLPTALHQMAQCRSFTEQCSLWKQWANSQYSTGNIIWLVIIGEKLMRSGQYCPTLANLWCCWRAICQTDNFGISRFSTIPNFYFNDLRRICYLSCLRRIETHPDDIIAMNAAAALAGRTNINRMGGFIMGNDAPLEEMALLPGRFSFMQDEDDTDTDDSDLDTDTE